MKIVLLDNHSVSLKLNLTSWLSSALLLFKFAEHAVVGLISRPYFNYNELLAKSVLKLILEINSEYKMCSLISVSACTVQSWNLLAVSDQWLCSREFRYKVLISFYMDTCTLCINVISPEIHVSPAVLCSDE